MSKAALIALAVIFVVVVCVGDIAAARGEKPPSKQLEAEWLAWKARENKTYSSNHEEEVRMLIWEENLRMITAHNRQYSVGNKSYTLKLNHWSDLTSAEFRQQMNGYKRRSLGMNTDCSTVLTPSNNRLPDQVDWRKEGYVTLVKNQRACGSCWAFSATGALEGQHAKKTGLLVSLSEQNLVDCSKPEGNDGCRGGEMEWAFQYVVKNGGIDGEICYPYEAWTLRCRYRESCRAANATGCVQVLPHGNEKKLKEASATVGPISVGIDASDPTFLHYHYGVYDSKDCSTDDLDHGVLVVGYGTTSDGKDYWLVKNSWGFLWGEAGYIKMSRNKHNQCGIATDASYPLV